MKTPRKYTGEFFRIRLDAGRTQRAIAQELGISATAVRQHLRKWKLLPEQRRFQR